MKYLAWIPTIVRKVIGYSCTLFLLGWGAYEKVETRLHARDQQIKAEMRIERQVELSPINSQMAVLQNDVLWLKGGVSDANSKLDTLLIRMK
jgi:hypothetical protein